MLTYLLTYLLLTYLLLTYVCLLYVLLTYLRTYLLRALKKLQKKMREITKLQQQQAGGRALSAEELTKVASLPGVEAQAALLRAPATPAAPAAAASTASAAASAAPTVLRRTVNAAAAAAEITEAQAALNKLPELLPTRPGTRANHLQVAQQMHEAREQLARERLAREMQLCTAVQDLLRLLRAPLDSWDNGVLWQLAMCEFALRVPDGGVSSKQLQLAFRGECEEARHPSEVPRLHGSLHIDVLREALLNSEPLRCELDLQLARYKRLYASMLSGFGRFRQVVVLQGETLLALMQRTHGDSLHWRPPGRAPAEALALVSMDKGRYTAEWRVDSHLLRHYDAGKTLALRAVVGVNKALLRRLKKLPEGQKPSVEHFSTLRLHDYHAHRAYREKALLNSFTTNRCTLQSDEVWHSTHGSRCAYPRMRLPRILCSRIPAFCVAGDAQPPVLVGCRPQQLARCLLVRARARGAHVLQAGSRREWAVQEGRVRGRRHRRGRG